MFFFLAFISFTIIYGILNNLGEILSYFKSTKRGALIFAIFFLFRKLISNFKEFFTRISNTMDGETIKNLANAFSNNLFLISKISIGSRPFLMIQ
jgi:hypothetical protein